MNTVVFLKALADPTRLRLLNLCRQFELNVNELVAILEMGQSRISRHLKILSDSRLLRHRKDGLWTFYTLNGSSAGSTILPFLEEHAFQESLFNRDSRRAQQIINQRSVRSTRFFNAIAEDWDRLKLDIFKHFDVNAYIIDRLPPVDSVADLGCGTGDLLGALTSHAGTVIGIDKSEQMLERARSRFKHGNRSIDLRIGEMEHLPVRDGEVDAAIVNMTLHHLAVPGEALREIHRAIRDNGHLLLVELAKHDHEDMRETYGDQWLGFDVKELCASLEESGFNLEQPEFFSLNKGLRGIFIRAQKITVNRTDTRTHGAEKGVKNERTKT